MINNEHPESFHLDGNVVINLLRDKSKDVYWLIVDKKYKEKQTGPKRLNPFPWTKPTGKMYSNRYKRLVEKTELRNFILNSFIEL